MRVVPRLSTAEHDTEILRESRSANTVAARSRRLPTSDTEPAFQVLSLPPRGRIHFARRCDGVIHTVAAGLSRKMAEWGISGVYLRFAGKLMNVNPVTATLPVFPVNRR